MNISIIQGRSEHLAECAELLKDSELGMAYFLDNNSGQYIGHKLLKEGFDASEIHVAIGEAGDCVGFAWIQPHGAFHWFPFLHVLAVKREYRGRGIGRQLLQFFEQMSFVDGDKAFLLVGSQNEGAVRLYKRLGYIQVGAIPKLFISSATELLMMKEKSNG